jgi:hypothetical protein
MDYLMGAAPEEEAQEVRTETPRISQVQIGVYLKRVLMNHSSECVDINV